MVRIDADQAAAGQMDEFVFGLGINGDEGLDAGPGTRVRPAPPYGHAVVSVDLAERQMAVGLTV